jgi:hypothetical protein
MTELLLGLTVIFVGYVVYEVFKTVSQTNNVPPSAPKPVPRPTTETTSAPAQEEQAKPVPAATAPAKAEAAEDTERGLQLRNPATGEVSAAPTNYRFAKKWIKEALVTEGLLDRVYKPNELDDAAALKVKEALDKFRMLDKYQP